MHHLQSLQIITNFLPLSRILFELTFRIKLGILRTCLSNPFPSQAARKAAAIFPCHSALFIYIRLWGFTFLPSWLRSNRPCQPDLVRSHLPRSVRGKRRKQMLQLRSPTHHPLSHRSDRVMQDIGSAGPQHVVDSRVQSRR